MIPFAGIAATGGKLINKGEKAYEIAAAGGKHSGWLKNMFKRTTPEPQKSITSMEANILEHHNLINDPAKYIIFN